MSLQYEASHGKHKEVDPWGEQEASIDQTQLPSKYIEISNFIMLLFLMFWADFTVTRGMFDCLLGWEHLNAQLESFQCQLRRLCQEYFEEEKRQWNRCPQGWTELASLAVSWRHTVWLAWVLWNPVTWAWSGAWDMRQRYQSFTGQVILPGELKRVDKVRWVWVERVMLLYMLCLWNWTLKGLTCSRQLWPKKTWLVLIRVLQSKVGFAGYSIQVYFFNEFFLMVSNQTLSIIIWCIPNHAGIRVHTASPLCGRRVELKTIANLWLAPYLVISTFKKGVGQGIWGVEMCWI